MRSTGDSFQRTDIRNTDDVDIKALMHNKTTYYELAHTGEKPTISYEGETDNNATLYRPPSSRQNRKLIASIRVV
jgi:replication initiation and membrane attachment protein DnaB